MCSHLANERSNLLPAVVARQPERVCAELHSALHGCVNVHGQTPPLSPAAVPVVQLAACSAIGSFPTE